MRKQTVNLRLLVVWVAVVFLLPQVVCSQEGEKKKEDRENVRLRIEVTAVGSGKPIGNARVRVRLLSAEDDDRDVSTNRDGVVTLDVPRGEVLIQVTSAGWQSFGEKYKLNQKAQIITIRLTPDHQGGAKDKDKDKDKP